MEKLSVVITNKTGIHARPARTLVKLARSFASEITITTANGTANAKNILSVLALAAVKGTSLEVQISGSDERNAEEAISKLFANNLDEDE